MKDDRSYRQALRWTALGELSSRVAHDSNNLLAGILGKAELGLLSNDPAKMRSSLESILSSSRELKLVTERLLGFKKLMEEGPRSTNLVEVFRTLYAMLERAFAKAGITVEWHLENLPTTWCEPGTGAAPLMFALRSGLESLRSAGGGTMLLEGAQEGEEIVFRVQVTALDGTALNDPRERAGDLTFEQAAEFAEHEGGTLKVERSAGQYVLSCRFPLRRVPPGRDAHQAPWPSTPQEAALGHIQMKAAAANPRPRPLVALVVEDERPIRELIQEVLEGVDCQVDAEADAMAALEVFGRRRFDVVFTDISMPGMDGVTLVKKLRTIHPETLVVVVTGRATEDAVRAAMSAGAKLVLRKPFELSDIRTVVENIRIDPSGSSLAHAARQFSNLLVN